MMFRTITILHLLCWTATSTNSVK